MSVQPAPGTIPQWTQGDRMRKALHHADVSVQQMADYLDVGRNTVSTWINDRIEPSTQTLRLWSLRTGVPLEWLRNGVEPTSDPGGPLHGPDSATRQYHYGTVLTMPVRRDLATAS